MFSLPTLLIMLTVIFAVSSLKTSASLKTRRSSFLQMNYDFSGLLNGEMLKVETTHPTSTKNLELNPVVGSPLSKLYGAGSDERFSLFPVNDQLEADALVLSKLEISYRRFGLMSELTSDKYGVADKLTMIRDVGVSQELLPSFESQIGGVNVIAGGLMRDWTFEM